MNKPRLIRKIGKVPVGTKGRFHWYAVYECPECLEEFQANVSSVNIGNNKTCRDCSYKLRGIKNSDTLESMLTKFKLVHGDLYDYSRIEQANSSSKITIGCYTHGEYTQTPNKHISGQGCPKCAKERSDISKRLSMTSTTPTKLYYVYIQEFNLWKVGCTTKASILDRFSHDKLNISILLDKEYATGAEAYFVESYILGATRSNNIDYKPLKSKGNTELRSIEITNIATLILEAEATYSNSTNKLYEEDFHDW